MDFICQITTANTFPESVCLTGYHSNLKIRSHILILYSRKYDEMVELYENREQKTSFASNA